MLRKFLIAGIGATALVLPAGALADDGGSGVPDLATLQANIAAPVNVQVASVQQGGLAASSSSADAKADGGDGGKANGGSADGGAANSGAVGGVAGASGGDANQKASADGGNSSARADGDTTSKDNEGGNSSSVRSFPAAETPVVADGGNGANATCVKLLRGPTWTAATPDSGDIDVDNDGDSGNANGGSSRASSDRRSAETPTAVTPVQPVARAAATPEPTRPPVVTTRAQRQVGRPHRAVSGGDANGNCNASGNLGGDCDTTTEGGGSSASGYANTYSLTGGSNNNSNSVYGGAATSSAGATGGAG